MEKEPIEMIEGDDDTEFWLSACEESIGAIWNNDEDDVYEQLV